MGAATDIEKLKRLRTFSATLRGATGRWQKAYSDRKHYDKQGFGFTSLTETSWNAFKCPQMAFDAHVGTYGSSSVSNAWRADQDLVNTYFVKALNQHKQAILDSMAALADADAEELRDGAAKELDALRKLLESSEQVQS